MLRSYAGLEVVCVEERTRAGKKEGGAEWVEGCTALRSQGKGGNVKGLQEGRGMAIDLKKIGLIGTLNTNERKN